jgi:hypothetical protein
VTPTVTPVRTVPGAPTDVGAAARNQSATVRWTAPADDGGSPITGYRITPHRNGTPQAPIVVNPAARTRTVDGLQNGTPYRFTVAAINEIGTSADSGPSSDITPGTDASVPVMPLISRGARALSNDACDAPSNATDDDYNTTWAACRIDQTPAWLALDLSHVPPAARGRVVFAWFNDPITGAYDHATINGNAYFNVGRYTVETNTAPGGSAAAPANGWQTVAEVSANTLNSRQHLIDLDGANWIRICVSATDGVDATTARINVEVYDASAGHADNWILYGDSITQDGLLHDTRRGSGEATTPALGDVVANLVPGRRPLFQDAGVGGFTSTEAAKYVPGWLALFPGQFVALSFGTNDALIAGPGDETIIEPFHDNMEALVKAVLAAGKTPVVPTIPWGSTPSLLANIPPLNAQIRRLRTEYPQIVEGPDLYSLYRDAPELLDDGTHPTWDAGYTAYRQVWAEAMASIYP